MAQNIEIEVQARSTGKTANSATRRKNLVPAVMYGTTAETAHLAIETGIVKKYASSKFNNAIITLKSTDSKVNGKKVFIKSYTVHPLTRVPLHLDLLAIDMNREVRVSVELKFIGTAKGVKDGGLMQVVNHDIEVLTLPANIPDFIEVNVSELGINDSLHASEVTLPKGVKHLHNAETVTLVTVAVQKEEEVAAPVVAAAAATPAAGAPGAAAPAAGAAAAPAAGSEKKDAAKK